jgi:hypothetical protein
MSTDGSPQSTEQSPIQASLDAASVPLKSNERPTTRTALRDLERKQFDALEAAQLRDLDR